MPINALPDNKSPIGSSNGETADATPAAISKRP